MTEELEVSRGRRGRVESPAAEEREVLSLGEEVQVHVDMDNMGTIRRHGYGQRRERSVSSTQAGAYGQQVSGTRAPARTGAEQSQGTTYPTTAQPEEIVFADFGSVREGSVTRCVLGFHVSSASRLTVSFISSSP